MLLDPIVLALLTVGFYFGWNIGASDASNAIGTTVGSRVLPYRRALFILVIFVMIGAALEGWRVTKTVGEGIITSDVGNPLSNFPKLAIAVLLAAGLWATITTTLGLPASTSQSIVGAVIGAGILLSVVRPASGTLIQTFKLTSIMVSWLIAPVIAMAVAFIFFHAFQFFIKRVKNIVLLDRVFAVLLVSASALVAYVNGANDGGAAAGVMYAVLGQGNIVFMQMLGLFGGVAIAMGAITYSKKVVQTVGIGITRLSPMTAFVAQLGAAITVWLFVQFGTPVSITQSIVGAVVGVGLTKGTAAVSGGRIRRVALVWIVTPFIGCLLSILFGAVLLNI